MLGYSGSSPSAFCGNGTRHFPCFTFVSAVYEGRGGKKRSTPLVFLSSSVKPTVPQGVIIICGATFYKDDHVFKAVLYIKKALIYLNLFTGGFLGCCLVISYCACCPINFYI